MAAATDAPFTKNSTCSIKPSESAASAVMVISVLGDSVDVEGEVILTLGDAPAMAVIVVVAEEVVNPVLSVETT